MLEVNKQLFYGRVAGLNLLQNSGGCILGQFCLDEFVNKAHSLNYNRSNCDCPNGMQNCSKYSLDNMSPIIIKIINSLFLCIIFKNDLNPYPFNPITILDSIEEGRSPNIVIHYHPLSQSLSYPNYLLYIHIS